jgi:hypothetical protein
VNELVENLNAKRAKMRRKLTTDEAITALERGCITARKDWGLQMRNNKCVVRRVGAARAAAAASSSVLVHPSRGRRSPTRVPG